MTIDRTDAGYAGNFDAADTPNTTLIALQATIKTPHDNTDATRQRTVRAVVDRDGHRSDHGANPPAENGRSSGLAEMGEGMRINE